MVRFSEENERVFRRVHGGIEMSDCEQNGFIQKPGSHESERRVRMNRSWIVPTPGALGSRQAF
jgi:hypothetical protein